MMDADDVVGLHYHSTSTKHSLLLPVEAQALGRRRILEAVQRRRVGRRLRLKGLGVASLQVVIGSKDARRALEARCFSASVAKQNSNNNFFGTLGLHQQSSKLAEKGN